MKKITLLCALALALGATNAASADVLQAGANRLCEMQRDDGTWDWRFIDTDSPKDTDHGALNILAPAAMGLAQVYASTDDPTYETCLANAGWRLLHKFPVEITPEDGYLAVALDAVFGGTTYRDYVMANFYDPLATGTYDFLGDGTFFVDTETYVLLLGLWREYQGLPNLAALDCGLGLYSASLIGADTSAWLEGTKAELERVNGADVYDILALAGAVLGLTSLDEQEDEDLDVDFNPNAGAFAAASSVADLAATLATYQLSTGGFTWNSQNLAEEAANETVQETAFAILALAQADPVVYRDTIELAAAYLESVQLPTGGWENALHQGENHEVTGETLWALTVARKVLAAPDAVEDVVE